MPTRIKLAQQRRVIAKLLMAMLKIPAETHFDCRHFGSRCDDVLLMSSILIGQVERRPMTAAKLADYAGVPRATVVRKLRQYCQAGMVDFADDGTVIGLSDHMNPDGIEDIVRSVAAAIHKASAELSNLDT